MSSPKIGWCAECGKELKEGTFSSVIYDKCWGKVCPDCGKIRKVGKIETVDLGEATTFKCLGCGKMGRIFVRRFEERGGVCGECFDKREERRDGCICYTKGILLCPICDEVHAQPRICEECF